MWRLSRAWLHTLIAVVVLFSTRAYGIKWPTSIDVSVMDFDGFLESEINNRTNLFGANNDVNWTQIYLRGIHGRRINASPARSAEQPLKDVQDESIVYDLRFGLFLFTSYCGPGSRIWKRIFPNGQRSYSDIDQCCKMHDGCPNFVEKREHYGQYPGLEIRPQYFSRLGPFLLK